MYKITTHENGTQSIVTIQPGLDIEVIVDGETPKKSVEVEKLPNTKIGKVMGATRVPIDSERKKDDNSIKEPKSL